MRPELPPPCVVCATTSRRLAWISTSPTRGQARRARDDIVDQTDDYLLPRLEQMEAPSDGRGRLDRGREVDDREQPRRHGGQPGRCPSPDDRAYSLRHPDDLRWFEDDRILPRLPRTTGGASAPGTLLLVPAPEVPAGLALLDSPDIDSVLSENRALATQLLAAADAWLFVTTAARYADAVPWEFLATARERGRRWRSCSTAYLAMPSARVTAHLQEMMRAQRIDAVLLVVGDGARAGAPSGGRPRARAPLARRARSRRAGADRADPQDAHRSAAKPSRSCRRGRRAAAEQLAAAADLRSEADLAYASARQEIEDALRSGSLLRREVVARWHEVVGIGELMRELQSRLASLRDRLASVLTGREMPAASSARPWSTGSRLSFEPRRSAPPSVQRSPG